MLIAIDPGLPCTLAHLEATGDVAFCEADRPSRMVRFISNTTCPVVIEKVAIFPGEDLKYGAVFVGLMYSVFGICAALGRDCYAVPPVTWKRQSDVPGKKEKGAGKVICAMAAERWPLAKALIGSNHNRGDALLLGSWALRNHDQLERWRVA